MVDYVVAGAASIENVVTFLDVVKQSRIAVMLIENEAMWSQIPISHQEWVLRSNEIPDIKAPLIPLNEYWVTQAINAGVTNISPHALRASRSKYYLSAHLKQCGVETLSRSYLDNIDEPGPVRYLARLDAGYSGYGIIRDIEAGVFNRKPAEFPTS